MKESSDIPDQLEEYFNEIFPGAHLKMRFFEKVADQNLSAFLTTKYLLVLIEEFIVSSHHTYEQKRRQSFRSRKIRILKKNSFPKIII